MSDPPTSSISTQICPFHARRSRRLKSSSMPDHLDRRSGSRRCRRPRAAARGRGQQPQTRDAERLQVVEPLGQPLEIADAVVVAVEKRFDVRLIMIASLYKSASSSPPADVPVDTASVGTDNSGMSVLATSASRQYPEYGPADIGNRTGRNSAAVPHVRTS